MCQLQQLHQGEGELGCEGWREFPPGILWDAGKVKREKKGWRTLDKREMGEGFGLPFAPCRWGLARTGWSLTFALQRCFLGLESHFSFWPNHWVRLHLICKRVFTAWTVHKQLHSQPWRAWAQQHQGLCAQPRSTIHPFLCPAHE